VKPISGPSRLAAFRDDIITFAYGHEKYLIAPQHLTTDSKGRVIVSDPAAAAVHVFDGRASFRIAGGPRRRLQAPNGIAVDSRDNIYVADSQRGLIDVYVPQRTISPFHRED
jgi:sugar lactone lactonase YvrE